jgi:hypothetical protein
MCSSVFGSTLRARRNTRWARTSTATNSWRRSTRAGHIDVDLWRKHREHCGLRRFWEGQDDEIGHLVHKPGGGEHARWVFDYDGSSDDDDEAGYRFGHHVFRPGEYVSIRGEDGELHTFQVISVEPAT